MSLMSIKKSFSHAFRGLITAVREENNFRVQLVFALGVLILSVLFCLTRMEFIAVILCISAVLTLELINTAIENFLDIIKPRMDLQVRFVKDILAGMVLISSLASLIVGSIIFYPYFDRAFESLIIYLNTI